MSEGSALGKFWTVHGGWLPEEEGPLTDRFGDDVTLELLARSPVDPRVLIVWVEWDRLPPSIYLVDFRRQDRYGLPVADEYMSVAEIKAGEWGRFFPEEAAQGAGERDVT